MTTWADANLRAGALAAETHADLGLSLDRPIDVFAAIAQKGIVLAFADLGRVSGIYLPRGASRPESCCTPGIRRPVSGIRQDMSLAITCSVMPPMSILISRVRCGEIRRMAEPTTKRRPKHLAHGF